MCQAYKNNFSNRYNFAVTEIAERNKSSLNAHKRIDFESLYRYNVPDRESWEIVLWN
jgi:hypothetical protein